MTEVYKFSESEILFFSMVLIRMSAFVVSWPVFGVENVPQHVKALFALILTMVIFPTIPMTQMQASALQSSMILLVMREAFIGVSMGFLVGDVNNSRSILANDASAVKARAGQATNAGNYVYDINVTGIIGASDIAAAKKRIGNALP